MCGSFILSVPEFFPQINFSYPQYAYVVFRNRLQTSILIVSESERINYRSSRLEVFCKKGVLKSFVKFTGKHLCQSLFFHKVAGHNFIKKETLAQVFSCEFYEISKNSFFIEHLWWLLL